MTSHETRELKCSEITLGGEQLMHP